MFKVLAKEKEPMTKTKMESRPNLKQHHEKVVLQKQNEMRILTKACLSVSNASEPLYKMKFEN